MLLVFGVGIGLGYLLWGGSGDEGAVAADCTIRSIVDRYERPSELAAAVESGAEACDVPPRLNAWLEAGGY